MPATNIVFFSDFKTQGSFRAMHLVADRLYDASIEDRLQLTKNSYIRKDGTWVKFLDTEEQFTELIG